MNQSKTSFEDALASKVIAAGKCVNCGACVIVCPFNCLEYTEERPRLTKECKICGICGQACIQYDSSQAQMERFVFNRERKPNETFGIYRRLTVARTKDDKILKASQDGGVVTTLLLFALKSKLIDGAIVSGTNKDKPFLPIPKLATTRTEIMESAGTRYSYSPNILALTEAIKQKKKNIAFVGTPCQIQAIRKMQMNGLKKQTAPLRFLIGLACSECFTYEGLIEKQIHQDLGLNLQDIKKIQIKGKLQITTDSGTKTISLAEAKKHTRKNCLSCSDFSSELADISAASLGLNGWTFMIIRTKQGEELFSKAEKAGILTTRKADEEANAIDLLEKLSNKKRKVRPT
jgi:coenzyme F420 hydrogenase subunit beta